MPHRLAWIACALATTVLPGTTRTLNAHPADHHIAASVARALEQLPSYGVFDLLRFSIDHGTVTLEGYAYQAGLVSEAVVALERVAGVSHVANKVQPLPISAQDDWIRHAVFKHVYTDDFRARYAIGGSYLIHIAVRNGHVTLAGVVHSDEDNEEVLLRARAVIGPFAVDNNLISLAH